jgi:hypothetical protein
LIETSEADQDSNSLLPPKVVEELVFSMKVEDKPKIYQMAVDNLAFSIYLATNKQQFINLINKSIGAK